MDNMQLVQKAQDYIRRHSADEDFHIDQICEHVGYSRRHMDRLFKKYLDKTLYEYVKSVILSQSAVDLIQTECNVLDIALKNHFTSHEGFTRSFGSRFHATPEEYRMKQTAIPLFVQYPVSHYSILCNSREECRMNEKMNLCMITAKERPARKLIYLPAKKAVDYLSYCEEKGCDWEGLLNSIPEKFDTAALIELPEFLIEPGQSKIAAGVEVPPDYDKPLPEQFLSAELCECTMLYFQSEPYENEDDFCSAIGCVSKAVGQYDPSLYGYRPAYDIAPRLNLGANTKTGARIAVPVVQVR